METQTLTGDDVLRELMEGNARFSEQRPAVWLHSPEYLKEMAREQRPLAAVLCCSDARAAPEVLFDQPMGRLFVARVPGNVLTSEMTAALEYAVLDLGVPLVLVLGHTKCVAVTAASESGVTSGPLGPILLRIQTAVQRARFSGSDDLVRSAVRHNVQVALETMRLMSLPIRDKEKAGEVTLVGAVYDIETGDVEFLKG